MEEEWGEGEAWGLGAGESLRMMGGEAVERRNKEEGKEDKERSLTPQSVWSGVVQPIFYASSSKNRHNIGFMCHFF